MDGRPAFLKPSFSEYNSVMRRTASLLSGTLLAVLLASGADLPSGEDLLKLYMDRSGGAEAYAKAKNAEMTGTVEIAGINIGGTVQLVEDGTRHSRHRQN